MNSVVVRQGQSILDIAIRHTGSVEVAYEIAVMNGLSVSDSLKVGAVLWVPDVIKKNIVAEFNSKKEPATALTLADNNLVNQRKRGIGFMQITDGNAESNGFISS